MNQRLTKDTVLERCYEIHGNNFDYSKIDFTKKLAEKQIFICNLCGEYIVRTMKNHLKGQKCKCNMYKKY